MQASTVMHSKSLPFPLKPGWIGIVAVYLVFCAVFLRTFGIEGMGAFFPRFLGLEGLFIVLYSLVLWKYNLPEWLVHLYLGFQSSLLIGLLSYWPDYDFITALYLILSYQVSLRFAGYPRWFWIVALISLITGSLVYFHGFLHGLSLSLTNIVGCIVVPAIITTNHEIELARAKSQVLLADLQDVHQKLQESAAQIDELTAVQERNRLARELHDTVSQWIFSISLTTRSAQLLLEKDPDRLSGQLSQLQDMTANALVRLRSLITQLRPPSAES